MASSTPMDMSLSKLWETVKEREAWRPADHRVTEWDMTEATEHERIVQVSIQEPQVTDVG